MATRSKPGPSPDHKERLTECRRGMKKISADAFLLTNERDYFYMTGFTGEESAVMITPRDVYLITDRRFEEQIGVDCPWAKVFMRRGLLNPEVATACQTLKVKRLAVQSDALSLADHAALNKLTRGVKLVAAPSIVGDLRVYKSAAEVKAMSKAIRVAEDAYQAMVKSIRVGQTELEMAARLEFEMKCRGASGPAFGTICAEGANAALPHAHPGKRKVKKGSAILFDWGARVGGYCSDLTRMVFVGSIPPKMRRVFEVVLEAQVAAIGAVRPGARMCDVDAVARGIIADAGFGECFGHGLGHGLGLDVHERPSLSWRSDAKLEPGMLVTVEPGIYLPGFGGVRIEDDVLVTPSGCRILTKLDKTLKGATIRP